MIGSIVDGTMLRFDQGRETGLNEDLKKFDVSTLILDGGDHQNVPIGASAMLSSKMVKLPAQPVDFDRSVTPI